MCRYCLGKFGRIANEITHVSCTATVLKNMNSTLPHSLSRQSQNETFGHLYICFLSWRIRHVWLPRFNTGELRISSLSGICVLEFENIFITEEKICPFHFCPNSSCMYCLFISGENCCLDIRTTSFKKKAAMTSYILTIWHTTQQRTKNVRNCIRFLCLLFTTVSWHGRTTS